MNGMDITRRSVLAAGTLAMAACARRGGSGGKNEVVVVDGGGDMHEALRASIYEPFEDETGIKVLSESYDYSIGTIKSQVNGAKKWDIVSTSTPMSDDEAGSLFAKINYTDIDRTQYDEQDLNTYFLWHVYSANNIAWSTEAFSEAPSKWSDLWDQDTFKGPRMLWNSPQSTLELALLADGVTWDDMYPLDVDRALAKLDVLRNEGELVWYDSGSQQQQMLANGSAAIGEGWNGRVLSLKNQGVAVNYTLDQAISGATGWATLKTAPNAENAKKFLDYAATAEPNAALAKQFPGMSPANTESYSLLDEELSQSLESNPINEDRVAGKMDYSWWGENREEVANMWQSWYMS